MDRDIRYCYTLIPTDRAKLGVDEKGKRYAIEDGFIYYPNPKCPGDWCVFFCKYGVFE